MIYAVNQNNIEDIIALTPVQEGMLVHYLREPGSRLYYVQLCLHISGKIQPPLLEEAWNLVVQHNEMLRTVFRWKDLRNPVQILLKQYRYQIRYFDLMEMDPEAAQKRLREEMEQERSLEFDFTEPPLRVSLFQLAPAESEMVINSHHIGYDGWSNGIILNELFRAYAALGEGRIMDWPVKQKFKQFVKEIREQDQGRLEDYWKKYLEGLDTQPGLTVKKSGPAAKKSGPATFSGQTPVDPTGKHTVTMSETLVSRISGFLRERRITLASFIYGVWGILLMRYNNSDDILFGTTVSGRGAGAATFSDVVGLFINTIPFRAFYGADNQTVFDYLSQIDRSLKERAEYENTALATIRKCSELKTHEELFDTIVVIENYPLDGSLTGGGANQLRINSYTIQETTHYALTLMVETFSGIRLNFLYHHNELGRDTVQSLAEHFVNILQEIATHPDQYLNKVEMLSVVEKRKIITEFNDTGADYPVQKTIPQLFEESVAGNASRLGVIFNNETITYGEFNEKANQVAGILREKGVKDDTIVAVCMERCPEMLVGLYGILKAGGAYLPIDPEYPNDRIKYILEDSGAEILLTLGKYCGRFRLVRTVIDLEDPRIYTGSGANRQTKVTSGNLAYVIYTSGSTGQPKGALIEQRAVINRINWMQKAYPIRENDLILHKTPYVFDVSVWELFWWAFQRAAVCLLEPGAEKNPAAIVSAIQSHGITIIHFVPSMLNLFLDYIETRNQWGNLRSLRLVFASGEALGLNQVLRFNQLFSPLGAKLINLYGPTEATVDVSFFNCSMEGEDPSPSLGIIPIGKPIDNIKLFVVDRHSHLQPVGVPGELCIAGIGLARGYLNRPDLTADKFVSNPFFGGSDGTFVENAPPQEGAPPMEGIHETSLRTPPQRIYRTGDLARWLPDGNIEYLGRLDHQVKIRGFRVELQEIESRILEFEGVKETVVVVREDKQGDSRLVAYVVAPQRLEINQLKQYLTKKLPGYMIPAFMIQIPAMPLTQNGKLDRNSLPEPWLAAGLEHDSPAQLKNEMEKLVGGIWQESLGINRIGPLDNFFDLGGNSFKLIKVTGELSKVLNREVPVTTMFQYPTIRSISAHLLQGAPGMAKTPEAGEIGVDDIGSRSVREIAVVGMAGKFPGAANIHEFWENLKNGIESISRFTDAELIEYGCAPELLSKPNYVKAKGALEGVEDFDAAFFGYSTREAQWMDPQLRLLHTCIWEALEYSGYNPENIQNSVGVFLGASSNFYWLDHLKTGNPVEDFNTMLFNERDFFSLRIAYKLNLKGPSLTVQTACSTSLVAIDTACRSILEGKCEMAIAGGVSLTHPLKSGYLYEEGMIFSPDGHCRAFDQDARGTLAGNGVGIVILKSLATALRDRDTIHAVIKGTAVNNDGSRKAGFTAPSVEGQAEVIRAAQKNAQIEPETITYLETHGTGTELGDLVELEALKLAFNTDQKEFCRIGSVKTNIGHLDSAAGAAGFIKTVLALKERLIPPSLHFTTPNPRIDIQNSPFLVNRTLTEWSSKGPLRAGVSAFGIGGANAHVVLEEAPQITNLDSGREWKILLLSARTPTALENLSRSLADFLGNHPGLSLADVAYTLQAGRKEFNHRRFLICRDFPQAIQGLTHPETGKGKAGCAPEVHRSITYLFSGLGSQYPDMGRDLYEREAVFRAEMDRCIDRLNTITGLDFKELIYPGGNKGLESPAVDLLQSRPEISHPIIFAFEYGLAAMLMKWGLKPSRMIGYSLGEYVAAVIAGVFSLEDGLKLVVQRAKLIQEITGGAMLSVPLPEAELRPILWEKLWISIINGPSCVISGPKAEVEKFERLMRERKYLCVPVNNAYAVHSEMMAPIAALFRQTVGSVQLNPPVIPYISNVTGTWIKPEEAVDSDYWIRHLRQTVRFGDGLTELLADKDSVLIEIGPNRDLSTLVRGRLSADHRNLVINLIRHPNEKVDDTFYLYHRLGELWLGGLKIDWPEFYAGEDRYRIPLPTYPFEMRPYPARVFLKSSDESRNPNQKLPDLADWFYLPTWTQMNFSASKGVGAPPQEKVLLFLDETEFGRQITEMLEDYHQAGPVIMVKRGQRYQVGPDSLIIINPEQQEDYLRLFAELRESGGLPSRIIYLWNLDFAGAPVAAPDGINPALTLGFYSLLHLAKAWGANNIDTNITLDIITDNWQDITGAEELRPEKAVNAGPALVIPLEYPNFSCRIIDISFSGAKPGAVAMISKQVIDEIFSGSKEAWVAFRGIHRWVRRFEPVKLPKQQVSPAPLRTGGVYLITGGLGGIGLTIARHLARNYRAKLILLNRTAIPPRERWPEYIETGAPEKIRQKVQQLMQLEEWGAEVLVLQGDVSRIADLQRTVKDAEEKFKTIHGVFHTAGIPDGGLIQLRSGEISEEIFAAKVWGTILLDQVFRERNLDFLLFCSSLSAITGALGQVAYCAANAFQDAFAKYRNRFQGKTTIGINWDTWSEVGMAVDSLKDLAAGSKGFNRQLHLAKKGIAPTEGIEILERVLAASFSQVVISTCNLAGVMNDIRNFESAVVEEEPSGDFAPGRWRPGVGQTRPELITEYVAATNDLERLMAELLQSFFGMERVGVEDNFFDLGASSFDIIRINVKLKEILQREIPILSLFRYPTVRSLAGYLSDPTAAAGLDPETQRTGEISKGRKALQQRLQKRKRWEQGE
ncbi:MAG TPA: amino acid adenylation domain-containing protein [Bacillota bacterium]|nr:amino acid adenylation domain-containing protein [Bacillota bacterium]